MNKYNAMDEFVVKSGDGYFIGKFSNMPVLTSDKQKAKRLSEHEAKDILYFFNDMGFVAVAILLEHNE